MWVESVLVVGDQIVDAAELDGWALTVGACDPAAPCVLLAHVMVTEDHTSVAAYTGLTVLALQGDPAPYRHDRSGAAVAHPPSG